MVVAGEVEDLLQGVGEHLAVQRDEPPPDVEFLERVVNAYALVEEVVGDGDFPFDLSDTSADVIGDGKPFGADQVEKCLNWNVGVGSCGCRRRGLSGSIRWRRRHLLGPIDEVVEQGVPRWSGRDVGCVDSWCRFPIAITVP